MVTIKQAQKIVRSKTHLDAITREETIICRQPRGGLSANESKKPKQQKKTKNSALNDKLNYCEIKNTAKFLNYVLIQEKRSRYPIFKRFHFISDTWPINLSPDKPSLLLQVK